MFKPAVRNGSNGINFPISISLKPTGGSHTFASSALSEPIGG
jgi:hypothetical protein